MKQIVFLPGTLSERQNCHDRIEMLQPHPQNPILRPERPWEDGCAAYPCVLYIEKEGLYKMWYMTVAREEAPLPQAGTLIDNHEMRNERSYVCYATSKDGLTWQRPALDVLRADKYPGNNIVYQDSGFFCGCPTVLYDEQDPSPGRRYKLMIYDNDGAGRDGIRTMVSSDGIHWEQAGAFPAVASQDTPSLWFNKTTGEYVAFLKDRVNGQRARFVSKSRDFESWSPPQPTLVPDGTDPTTLNYYSQCVFTDFGQDFTFVCTFDLDTQTTELELAAVYDGHCVRLPSRPRVLHRGTGQSWDNGGVYNGNAEPVERDGRRWLYYGGSGTRHDALSNDTSVGLAGFVPGRLAGQQFEGEGYFVSMSILCPGGKLYLNAETGGNALLAEVQGSGYTGTLRPYTAEGCVPVSGDGTMLPVTWQGAANLDSLAGRYIRLKISGKDARVYGATFAP